MPDPSLSSSDTRGIDLLLVHPNERENVYQHLSRDLAAIEPPLWAAMTAAFIRRRGFSVAILDAQALELSQEEAVAKALEFNPRLVALALYGHQPSASTQNMPAAGNFARFFKESPLQIPILFFGGHVAALPEKTLEEESIDFACSGEGPYTIADLLETLKKTQPDFSRVRDLWYKEKSQIVKSKASAELIQNLDEEMPSPAWNLLPMDRYRAHNWHCFGGVPRLPYASLYTTLGCPYHCSFCCIQAPFREGEKTSGFSTNVNSYRFWSPAAVLKQIDELVTRYGIKNIKIADEMFVLNDAHVEALCDGMIERNYNLNLWAYARVDTVRDSVIQKLKRAGFHWLALGVESADSAVRADIAKSYSQELIFSTIQKIRDAGISVIANYIFGLPEDTMESMQATLDLSLKLNTEFANFYCAMAYPGSALFKTVQAQNLAILKWSSYSQHGQDALPLPTRHLSSAEILRFRDEAFETYFSNPRYHQLILEKFGPETLAEIKRMGEHQLFRFHA